MHIDSSLVQAYTSGKDMHEYKTAWFFSSSTLDVDLGRNIFSLPPDDDITRETVCQLETQFRQCCENFVPVNRPIWDVLSPGWQEIQPIVDLIVGFPEPYDAVTVTAPDGKTHLVFDLICWKKYAERKDLNEIIRNLLTHETTHFLIGRRYPEVDAALESPDYMTKLDAYTFHEGFAHLISYQATDIDRVNWHSGHLSDVYRFCKSKMESALTETDPARQTHYLYDAICGAYYEKFACMCGMLYLADQWEANGIHGLQDAFKDYHGFARRTVE